MKLKEFLVESALIEVRAHIRDNLFENINDYLSLTLAKLNNKKPQDLFKAGSPDEINLDHLAMIIAGLKVVANPDFRAGLTKQDIGINPNDAKDLFNLLNQVDKQGKDQGAVINVFKAVCKLAPQGLKNERAKLDIFKTGDDAERKHEAQELQKLVVKVGQMFNKIRTAANSTRGVDIPTLGDM